jgi:hypothetical protein
MRTRRFGIGLALALVAIAFPTAVRADDLAGSDRVLCTAVQAMRCSSDGDCRTEPPWNLNIPQFLEVNLKEKTVSTTKASGENRATAIRGFSRENGLIVLQGIEEGRAFSFVIDEASGMASIAVARDSMTVSVFGACTPMPAAK